ncbi:MAG: NUDIX hydrolase, partial [Candidatus Dormibacteraceae bacterium]
MSSVFEGDGWDDSGLIRAAGGIVLRWRDGRQELLLVHRSAYGDWSLPKGKLARPEEAAEDAAVREVREETGLECELELAAGSTRYRDQNGRPKVVRYWE